VRALSFLRFKFMLTANDMHSFDVPWEVGVKYRDWYTANGGNYSDLEGSFVSYLHYQKRQILISISTVTR
jgi:hypothetical protein